MEKIQHENQELKDKNLVNKRQEKKIFDTYEALPDLKIKRVLTVDQYAVLKEKLGELETEQRNELDGQIRLSRNKFMIRSRFGKTQNARKKKSTKKRTV